MFDDLDWDVECPAHVWRLLRSVRRVRFDVLSLNLLWMFLGLNMEKLADQCFGP